MEQLKESYNDKLFDTVIHRATEAIESTAKHKTWVNDGKLSDRAAVELSYMDEDMQEELYRANTDRETGIMLKKISEKTAKTLRYATYEKILSKQKMSKSTRKYMTNVSVKFASPSYVNSERV